MSADLSRRRHRPCRPSEPLLLLLASIAASATPLPASASNSPPPTFLCPSLAASAQALPDRFQQGDDGLWTEVAGFTFYGSTVSPSCKTVQVEADNPVPSPAPSPDSTFNIQDLPPGWKSNPVVKRTSLVISVSLALAIVICFFIVSCLLYKRARRVRRLNNVDLERKMKRKRWKRQPSDTSSLEAAVSTTKEQQVSRRIWARATARWMANVKYNARQRSGKRGILSSLQSQTAAAPSTRPEMTAAAPPQTECHNDSHDGLGDGSPYPPMATVLPPAYPHDSNIPSVGSSSMSSISGSTPSSNLPRTAHVATDDKAILAQMVGLVSAPPSGDASTSHGSAPAWRDEHEEDFISQDNPRSNESLASSTSFFPPPPSQKEFPVAYLDDPYTPESRLSAPPLEREDIFPGIPSAPPIPFDTLDASVPDWDDVNFHDITEGHDDQLSYSFLTSHTSPVQGPVSRSGELPSYQP